MPHIIIKLFPGRTEQQKADLAREIVKDCVEIAGCRAAGTSVAFEEILPEDWASEVWDRDIAPNFDRLQVKPDYTPKGR